MRTEIMVLVLLAACRPHDRGHRAPPPAPDVAAAPGPSIEDEEAADAKQAMDRVANAPVKFGTEPCATVPMSPPPALGDQSLSLIDDMPSDQPGDATYGYLLMYLRNVGSEVEIVAPPASHAPLDPRTGFDDPKVTLLVDQWIDPVMPATREGEFQVGTMSGRVLVWDSSGKHVVCGAKVTATNGDVTVVDETSDDTMQTSHEDPLSKARVDLINEALRQGLANLTAFKG